jgi:deoxyribodipyrimidine photolyase-related protein
MKRLILILGDQLWRGNPALADFNARTDRVLMIEAAGEGRYVWSHKARITLFLSAMRHFADELRADSMPVEYVSLDAAEPPEFAARLTRQIATLKASQVLCCEPGEWRMLKLLQDTCADAGVPLQLLQDTHFLCSREDFARWAGPPMSLKVKNKSLRMEFFYRQMRAKYQVLMTADGAGPEGGAWNFDADNRLPYPKSGPGTIAAPATFAPDAVTREVMQLVDAHFADHPAAADWQQHFAWPVTRAQALQALQRFIGVRLQDFGPYQDAMWTGTPFGWHSLLSAALNLHLITPLEVVHAAEAAYRDGHVPLASAEGFIRQILGWREFMRGVYWLDMPQLAEANHYAHARPLPRWYWTGDTRMACMRDAIGQTLRHGYAHHIQRLMVTGNFGLLAEVLPQAVCDWYLAVYVDALDWVELPNTAGMALNANGGRITSKPYIASGQYIKRQSNYCKQCPYDPALRTGDRACPMTVLYWRFLDKHEKPLALNPRTSLMAKSVQRLGDEERQSIRSYSEKLLAHIDDV